MGGNYPVRLPQEPHCALPSRQYATLPEFEAHFQSPKILRRPEPPNAK